MVTTQQVLRKLCVYGETVCVCVYVRVFLRVRSIPFHYSVKGVWQRNSIESTLVISLPCTVYTFLSQESYWVQPSILIQGYSIDTVTEGSHKTKKLLLVSNQILVLIDKGWTQATHPSPAFGSKHADVYLIDHENTFIPTCGDIAFLFLKCMH